MYSCYGYSHLAITSDDENEAGLNAYGAFILGMLNFQHDKIHVQY